MLRSRPCNTSGSHACIGASPTLRARAKTAIVVGRGCDICWMFHSPVNQALVVLANKSRAAAVA